MTKTVNRVSRRADTTVVETGIPDPAVPSLSAAQAAPISAPAGRGWACGRWATIARLGCLLLAGLLLGLMIRLLYRQEPLQFRWGLELLLVTAAFAFASYVAAMQYARWVRPTGDLKHLLEQIHAGEAAIDELDRIQGGTDPLREPLRRILKDWRQQQADLAKLEREMRQRVAQRTAALERLIGSLRSQAAKDPLTGLNNRRMLDQHLPELLERCQGDGADLCLVLMDLDHFKGVNDTLGHAAGDQVIADVGQLIRSTIRDNDLGFRYGGDEFVVLMPGSTRREGQALVQRLASLVDGLGKTLKTPKALRLGYGLMSLAEMPSAGPLQLMKAADELLYSLKASRKAAA